MLSSAETMMQSPIVSIMFTKFIRIADARRHTYANTSQGPAELACTRPPHVDTDRMLDNGDASAPGGLRRPQRTLERYRLALDRRSPDQGCARSSLASTLYSGYRAQTRRRCRHGTESHP